MLLLASNESRDTQRAELHKAIWGIADEVRGAVDGWDFKAYILCFLFYRFISEDLTEYIDEGEREASGDASFSYAKLSDEDAEMAREDVTKEKGFFILPSQLFQNVAEELFGHEGNKNKLLPEHIGKIARTVIDRTEEEHFSKLVSAAEFGGENRYNLSVSTWVEKKDTREEIDIVALNARIKEIVARENELRCAIDAIVADLEG